AHLAEQGIDGRDPDEFVWWLRRNAPFIHAPADDVPWSFGRRPRIVDAAAWLRDPAELPGEDDGLDHLVRRYLMAFGPATAADASQWSGLAIGRLRPAILRLEAAGEVERLTDVGARALLDVVDGPRPPADTPAPPRLLPMWDNTLLAFADRTRIISDPDRAVVIARNGDTLPTFTVDGRVAGLWWAERDTPTASPHIVLEPFRPIPVADRRALEREGDALAAWIAPLEPTVYARYRRTRARRPMPA
ncbi:MAG TPA: crosslink repair DNA glycosylase YcaQ family protein, partial [Candidatus Saccharimonadales bacterium]|nr:crosslink repair DNA glycosylase YcaQ family protein [Candidatus Saccharimonadales bacterium]